MNRPFKFRAWDKRTKSMLTLRQHSIKFNGEVFISVKDPWDGVKNSDDIKIMQITDVRDKYGKEIYEDDVVRILNTNWHVNWDCYRSRWGLMPYSEPIDKIEMAEDMFCVDCENDSEVRPEIELIGNIHQNPELMEKPK